MKLRDKFCKKAKKQDFTIVITNQLSVQERFVGQNRLGWIESILTRKASVYK
jgi:hypothetical protein